MRGVVPGDMNSTSAQGGIPRPLRGYEPTMEPSSPAPAWQFNSLIPKQEPMQHEERNDSGISGSDQASSPESNHSDNIPYSSPSTSSQMHHAGYYQTPMTHHEGNGLPAPFHNDHNPLTPPNSEPMASPRNLQSVSTDQSQTTRTPHTSPVDDTPQPVVDNSLRRLEMAIETGLLPSSSSPNPSETSGEYANSCDMAIDDDEQAINVPRVNSHGKVKQFKCKQCNYVAITKSDFWQHSRIHIKADKLLSCPRCPFVTEYKHHFEYHMNNHTGVKPFKCPDCNYMCVNKSMLNSHRKSHSDVYQFGCADCRYVTKYVHSLKIHLRKYRHQPDVVRNPDGTPNPIPIIDVYGTRRGPKIKLQKEKNVHESIPQPEPTLYNPFTQLMMNPNAPQMQLPFPSAMSFFPGAVNPFLLQNFEAIMRTSLNAASENEMPPGEVPDAPTEIEAPARDPQEPSLGEQQPQHTEPEAEVLDLSKPPEQPVQRNRRKGRAFKLPSGLGTSSDEDELKSMFNNADVADNASAGTSAYAGRGPEEKGVPNNNNKDNYTCQYCIINFGDPVLYTMHMGYHGFQHPFTCNMCGEECEDRVSFFLHIARTPHS